MKCFFFFLLVASSVYGSNGYEKIDFGNPEFTSEHPAMPSGLAAGCVNVISGSYCHSQTDLVVPGPHPIVIERHYSSSFKPRHWFDAEKSIANGWNLNQDYGIRMMCIKQSNKMYKVIGESVEGGRFGLYESPVEVTEKSLDKTCLSFSVSEDSFKNGLTNCCDGKINGQTNRKNILIEEKWHPYDDKFLVITNGSKGKMTYSAAGEYAYVLDNYRLPDGYLFTYDNDKNLRLTHVKTRNRVGERMMAVTLDYHDDNFDGGIGMEVSSKSGIKVSYQFEKIGTYYYLRKVLNSRDVPETYFYEERPKVLESEWEKKLRKRRRNRLHTSHRLVKKVRPEGRYLAIEYYEKGHNEVLDEDIKIKHRKDDLVERVKCLKAPVGEGDEEVITHSFIYQIDDEEVYCDNHNKGGTTRVYDAQQNLTEYIYGKQKRIEKIIKYKDDQPYSSINYHWARDKSEKKGNLVSYHFEGDGAIQYCRLFTYDEQGNIIKDALRGNLSGKNQTSLQLNHYGIPIENGCECYIKKAFYSTDGFNLLLWENDGRKTIEYAYYPETNLLKHKYTKEQEKVIHREFFEYDPKTGMLVKSITDNGCSDKGPYSHEGMTERRIKEIELNDIGLPETIREKYWDFQKNKHGLIQKVEYTYDVYGHVTLEKHYDANDHYAYQIEREYDRQGHVIKEVNALQEVTTRKYDDNGSLIYEQGPRPGIHKEFIYDCANRLRSEADVYDSGIRLSKTYRYNALSQLISSKDIYNNETTYTYDSLGRLIETVSPLSTVTKATYNSLGKPILIEDGNQNQTFMTYNCRGQMTSKTYSDGSQEKIEYTRDGLIHAEIARNGLKTVYTYDALSRPTLKRFYDKNNTLLYCTKATYDAFHLTTETDAMGIVTHYHYDGAGRLSCVTKGDTFTAYVYDALGRVFQTITHDTITEQEYDLLNRVITERTLNSANILLTQVRYKYDWDGNRTKELRTTQQGIAQTVTVYNAYKQPEIVTDPEGNETRTIFHYFLGVPCEETIDPLGNSTLTLCDTLGRASIIEKKNSLGKVIQKKELFYDANGNCIRILDIVIANEAIIKTIETLKAYDSMNQLTSLTEAAGTPDQRTTKLYYNSYGQKICHQQPNCTSLYQTYDSRGRLATYSSSDNTVSYSYIYDLNDNVLSIEDHINHSITQRTYDQNGWMTQEILGNGLKISYTHDPLGRITSITYPDQSQVLHSYKGCFLETVTRKKNNVTTTHTYTEYDLCGNNTKSLLMHSLGERKENYNKKGLLIKIEAPQRKETMRYDAMSNLLEHTVNSSPHTYTYDALQQLTHEKGTVEHTYTYDSLHNRLSKDKTSHAINPLNQLLNDGVNHYTYDTNGNLTYKTGNEYYVYDALNRLIAYNNTQQIFSYQYDSDHRRLSKTEWQNINGQWQVKKITRFLYQNDCEVGSYDEQGKPLEFRALGIGLGAEIGAAVLLELNEQSYVPLHDHNGNLVHLLDSTGAIAETYDYSAFGEPLTSDTLSPWRFSSKRTDPETGLVYFGRRYYDPKIGRWLTRDPIGTDDGPNLYAYVHNNPLTHIDLYGLFELFGLFGSESEVKPMYDFNSIFERFPFESEQQFWDYNDGVFDTFVPYWDKAGLFVTEGKPLEKGAISFINGIDNSTKDAHETCEMISELSGGYSISGVLNPTHGIFNDLLRSIVNLNYVATDAVKQLHRQWDTFFAICKIPYLQKGHSDGCINIRNALHLYNVKNRKLIHVAAFAPAAYIDPDTCGYVMQKPIGILYPELIKQDSKKLWRRVQ